MSKTYYGILDTRNTKYQGSIKDDKFSGVGILIDNLFLTIVSNWEKSSLNGQSLIIFPKLEVFFGKVINNKAVGVCCFHTANQKEKLIFEATNQSEIIIAQVSENRSITHLLSTNNKYEVKATYSVQGAQKQLQILSKIFQKQVKLENISMKEYLEVNFVQPQTKIEMFGNKQLFFGFKNTESIGFKFQQNIVSTIGNFTQFPRNLNYGRKILKGTYPKVNIQEGRFQQPVKTFIFPINKPNTEAQRFTQQYFKKSTTFRNQFIKLTTVDNLYIYLKKMFIEVQNESTKKFGQILLQNSNPQSSQLPTKQFTLSQVRQEIYKAASKKQGNSTQRSLRQHNTLKEHNFREPTLRRDSSTVNNRKHIKSQFIYDDDLGINSDRNHFINQFNLQQHHLQINNSPFRQISPFKQQPNDHYKEPYHKARNYTIKDKYVDRKTRQELVKKVAMQLQIEKLQEEAILRELISESILQKQIIKIQQHNNPIIIDPQSINYGYPKYKRYDRQGPSFPKQSPLKGQNFSQRTNKYNNSNQSNQNKQNWGETPYDIIRESSPKTYSKSPTIHSKSPIITKNVQNTKNYNLQNQKTLSKYQKKESSKYSYLNNERLNDDQVIPEISLFNRSSSPSQQPNNPTQNFVKEFRYTKSGRKDRYNNNQQPKKTKRTFNYVN